MGMADAARTQLCTGGLSVHSIHKSQVGQPRLMKKEAVLANGAVSAMLVAQMHPVLRNVLLVYAALLPIVNPLGMAPIFAAMTDGYDSGVRHTVAMRVAVNGLILLMASLFAGSYVLDFFGVSLAAVQLGGGLIVMISGWRILNQQSNLSERQVPEAAGRDTILSKAFYPLTMPLTVGPGSIAVALTLGSNLHEESHMQLIQSALVATVGIMLIGITIYLCYRYSDALERLLGTTGTSIVVRLSAFILVCIGIQIMFNGADEFYTLMVKNAKEAMGAR
jgi:multiple antibiotic resistance protein